MNGQIKILGITVVAVAVIILSQYAFAVLLPDTFYGSLMINENPAPAGTQVRGMINGVEKTLGSPYLTSTSGAYGSQNFQNAFQVQGDTSGQTIIFEVKTPDMSSFAAASPTGTIFGGGRRNINLTVTIAQECVNGQTQQCGSDVGACEFGTQTCSGGLWGACVGSIEPVAETCNNIDDDCDGLTDETFNVGNACSAGIGACTNEGVFICNEAETGTVCNAIVGNPTAEVCDNVDNDCDGTTDEQLVQQCGSTDVGACEFGMQTCFAGQWSACENNIEPATETCNSVDDDCDGTADETFANLGSSCSAGTGVCESAGTFVCSEDGSATVCNAAAGNPSAEVCDNLDNDCNGETDEGLGTISCGVGACQTTVDACVNGQAQACIPGAPAAEVCDSIDNNCNGQTDEGLGTLSCGTGSCQATVDACVNGQAQTCTPGTPSAETCDNADNDCDGQTDELQPITCGVGACQATVNACSNGQNNICTPLNPSTELCGDGIDNDCDGSVDEGFDVGQACSAGVGACQAAGIKVCSQDGLSTTCNAVPGNPSAETCDNADNDCDGQTDETFNTGQSCTAGSGACQVSGTFICSQDGSTTICNAVAGDGSAEVCDNVDNDCDGTTDEQLVQQCGSTDVGACEFGTQTCFAGQWSACENSIEPATETCNSIDDDCDGTADETFANLGSSCSAGTGICESDGIFVCSEDGSATICNAVPGNPSDEICDNLDNDCNSETDEGLGTQTCGVGACQNTVNVCVDGNDNACVPLDPSAEICSDQIDNDCDGATDSADSDCQCINNQTLSVATDNNIYEVGGTVIISGVLDISCGSEANKQIAIAVKKPSGEFVVPGQPATNSQGAYSTSLSLENAEPGEYEVQSAFNGSSSTKKFTVIQTDDEDFCIVITNIQILNSTFNTTTSVGRGKFYNVKVSNTNVCNDPVETMQIIQVMKGTLPINLGTVTSTIAPGTTSYITLGFTMPQSADTGTYSANAFNWNHWIDQDPSSFKILSKSSSKEFQVT